MQHASALHPPFPTPCAAGHRRPAGHPIGWRLLDAAAVVWLFLANGALLPLLLSEPGTTDIAEGGKELLRLLGLPSVAFALALAAARPRALLLVARQHPLLPLLLLWVWCSAAWSLDPGTTLRRATALTATTVIAAWLAVAYAPRALLGRVAWVLLAQLALSLLLAAAAPRLALMPGEPLLRGIFLHKNVLGQALAFAFILLALGWSHRFLPRPAVLLGLALVCASGVLAGSATALLVILLALAVQAVPRALAMPPPQAAAALLLAAGLGSFALLAGLLLLEPALGLFGRDLTLTGRRELWAYAVGMVEARPFLGYGYATLFDVAPTATYLLDALRWSIPNAHNGFLEVALGLGLPGLAMALLLVLGGLLRAGRALAARATDPPGRLGAAFALLYLTAYLARNLAESDLLAHGQLSWVLAVAALVMAGGAPAGGGRRAAAAP